MHRGLRFFQKPCLKAYIDLNTFHRTNAKNTFEKDYFKLLNKAVYGNTMENVDKRVGVKIITERESASPSDFSGPERNCGRSLISKSNFHSVKQFSENFFAFQIKRLSVLYNKPLYLGFAVLDLSKCKIYDFYYNNIKPKYNENVQLNYMDTYYFIYTIKTEDLYKDIQNDLR